MIKGIFERKESQGMEDRKIQNSLEGFKTPTAVQTYSAGVVHIFHVPPGRAVLHPSTKAFSRPVDEFILQGSTRAPLTNPRPPEDRLLGKGQGEF